ncbi:MAG: ribosome-associated translation inhibitor RaiA [Patescibacteria group bacterium]|nr:ribosome-associated translation inhibitor RaiA [Patescibacteria group bacterium]
MRIQVSAKGFDLTPSLAQFAEEKMMSLEKYLSRWDGDGGVIVRVEISKNTNHHNKGEVFYAEANMDLPKHVLRVEETAEDMHTAIDVLKDRMKNELLKLKDKLADH